MVSMTIEVPEPLAEQLEQIRSRLPEVLALGLEELSPLPNQVYRNILEFLVNHPSPVEILKYGPTAEMQGRVNSLLDKDRSVGLTVAETQELDEYVRIDHFITLLKARALSSKPALS